MLRTLLWYDSAKVLKYCSALGFPGKPSGDLITHSSLSWIVDSVEAICLDMLHVHSYSIPN